jgi:uncharacterized membrane protein
MSSVLRDADLTPNRKSQLSPGRLARALAPVIGIWAFAAPQPGWADLKLCNDTASRVGVAIGYRDEHGELASEGWWTVASQTCEVLLRGGLPSRLIYIRAIDYDQGGSWSGDMRLCTRKDAFAITGVSDCAGNGYQSEGFMEVDTGGSKQWTIRLQDSDKQEEGGS